jgi:hypothetical protein
VEVQPPVCLDGLPGVLNSKTLFDIVEAATSSSVIRKLRSFPQQSCTRLRAETRTILSIVVERPCSGKYAARRVQSLQVFSRGSGATG